MLSAKKSKSHRLEARITEEQKQMISLAADYEGLSITDFAVRHLMAISRRVVEEARVTELSKRDQEAFVEALLNPPEPNSPLRSAFQLYCDTVKELPH